MAWLSPVCRGSFARVFPLDDVPVGYRPVARRQAKHGLERDMSIKSSVVAEDEFVQVRIDVLAAEVGAEAPPLQEGEDPMDPFEGGRALPCCRPRGDRGGSPRDRTRPTPVSCPAQCLP